MTKHESMPARPAEDVTTAQRLPFAAILAKAGDTSPTGATLIGTLSMETIFGVTYFDGTYDQSEEVCVDGAPVFVDSEGLTWAAGADGNWEPVGVEPRPPQVEWLGEGGWRRRNAP